MFQLAIVILVKWYIATVILTRIASHYCPNNFWNESIYENYNDFLASVFARHNFLLRKKKSTKPLRDFLSWHMLIFTKKFFVSNYEVESKLHFFCGTCLIMQSKLHKQIYLKPFMDFPNLRLHHNHIPLSKKTKKNRNRDNFWKYLESRKKRPIFF